MIGAPSGTTSPEKFQLFLYCIFCPVIVWIFKMITTFRIEDILSLGAQDDLDADEEKLAIMQCFI
jgi:hypothetical protein